MVNEEHFRKLERMYASARTNEYYDPRLRVEYGAATVSVQVDPKFFHAAQAVHGSVYFKLLDDCCWFAVASRVEEVCVLTASFNIYLFRPVTGGRLTAAGRVVSAASRVFVAEGALQDDRGREVARGSGSFLRSQIALEPSIGYA